VAHSLHHRHPFGTEAIGDKPPDTAKLASLSAASGRPTMDDGAGMTVAINHDVGESFEREIRNSRRFMSRETDYGPLAPK
jgi:hypothetical protein